jgi:hypothetical protein
MLRHEVYTLHVYRSRAPNGWQWAARLEHLPGGESIRFTDPEALLAHLRTLMWGVDQVIAPRDTPAGSDRAETSTEEGGTQDGS